MLETAVASANLRSQTAQIQAEEFAAGRNEDIHGTMLALSQADIELRFVGNVRNKVIDAFYELWRMQV
jgi:flagellar hook-basal body complex protein FliE